MSRNSVSRIVGWSLILSIAGGAELASQATGFLRADGQRIVDGAGHEVLLKGMGLGGWLVPEGYMLQTQGFANAAWEIRQKIETLIGVGNADEFFRRYRSNYVKKKDIDSLAAWGFNSVRLPIHYALLTPPDQPGVYLEEGFAVIDSLLEWCEANRLYLILDLHAAPGGQSDENISDYNPSYPSLWESDQNKARTVALWGTIAARYAEEPWLGGYDLINEPKWDLGPGNVPLRDLYVSITQAIRSVDTNHIVFIEGNWFATDFTGLTPPWDQNMVYSFHKYWNENTSGAISGYTSLRSTYNAPLWLGETGENSNAWFTECVQLLQSSNIGWAWWPHKKFGTISAPFSVPITPEYDRVLKYWSGQASHPGTQFATDALLGMADRLDLDSCEVRRDVVDALMRQPYSNASVPFESHVIPGRIFAVDYDLGKRNVAYLDNTYQNVGGGTGNSGWRYRNDGVDIDVCNDSITNGFCVGWIETGEYMNYTVRVARTDTYVVSIRLAANSSDGSILVRMDGVALGPFIPVASTGGWQEWRTIVPGDIALTEGPHTLSLSFFQGGFNINYVEFASTTADAPGGDPPPDSYELFQNYPNPFNPRTTIRYAVPELSAVRIDIYNALGQLTESIDRGIEEPGIREHVWSPNVPTGVYYYRVSASTVSDPSRVIRMVRRMTLLQ